MVTDVLYHCCVNVDVSNGFVIGCGRPVEWKKDYLGGYATSKFFTEPQYYCGYHKDIYKPLQDDTDKYYNGFVRWEPFRAERKI